MTNSARLGSVIHMNFLVKHYRLNLGTLNGDTSSLLPAFLYFPTNLDLLFYGLDVGGKFQLAPAMTQLRSPT